MLKLYVLLIFSLPSLSFADCFEAYRGFQLKTLISPISSSSLSSGSTTIGSSLSFAGSSAGLISSQTELTTAGALYSAAFAYEGQYYLEGAWWDIRNFKSRAKVYKIMQQAQVGVGPELQELLVDINQRTFSGDYFSLEDLSVLINKANQEKLLCPKNRGVFTLKNLSNFILDEIGEDSDEDELNDYWDDFDDLF